MEITDFNSLIQAAKETIQKFGGQVWWRGMSNSEWDLGTRLYRENREIDEHNFAIQFKHGARVRYENCPPDDDHAGWLSLMQHYGLPTRLLDWTESCLVGLYFAVREAEFDKKPGALWGLMPTMLNKNEIDEPRTISGGPFLGRACYDAFLRPSKKQIKNIVAINPSHFDLRHLIQSSVFTVHGHSIPINLLPASNQFIVQHLIPADAKQDLLVQLEIAGINAKFVFPDLEHLAKDVAGREYR